MAKVLIAFLLLLLQGSAMAGSNTVYIDDEVMDNVVHTQEEGDFERPTRVVYRFLTTVRQDVNVSGTVHLESVTFLKLVEVGGVVSCDNNAMLREVDFPKLTELSKDTGLEKDGLVMHSNLLLKQISFPKLVTVRRNVRVQHNPVLDLSLSFCSLRDLLPRIPESKEWCWVSRVKVNDNGSPDGVLCGGPAPVPETCVLEFDDVEKWYLSLNNFDPLEKGDPVILSYPKLQKVDGGIVIESTTKIVALHFPKMTSVGPSYLYLRDNKALREVSLPVLTEVEGSVTLSVNPMLSVAHIPHLQMAIGSIAVEDNPNLDVSNVLCSVRIIEAGTRLVALDGFPWFRRECADGEFVVKGNLNDEKCAVPTLVSCPEAQEGN